MNIRNRALIFALSFTMVLGAAQKKSCPKGNISGRQAPCSQQKPCKGKHPVHIQPVVKQVSTGCGTHSTTVIYKHPKKRRIIPPVPGRFHVHFERGDDLFQTSNSIERVCYPYPVITR